MGRQDWPRAWLFTDERIDAAIDDAIGWAVAAGAGVVVRHHHSTPERRRAIARQVKAAGAVLGIARDTALAAETGADIIHNPVTPECRVPFSLSVHDEDEARAAAERGPALVFISPVYATRSHPGASPLGEEGALGLLKLAGRPAIALGGMDVARGRALVERGFHGWAGIDCWLRT